MDFGLKSGKTKHLLWAVKCMALLDKLNRNVSSKLKHKSYRGLLKVSSSSNLAQFGVLKL